MDKPKDVSANVCLLVLSGLPASGKSTLCELLTGHRGDPNISDKTDRQADSEASCSLKLTHSDAFQQDTGLFEVSLPCQPEGDSSCDIRRTESRDSWMESYRVFTVCYDDLIPEETEIKLILSSNESEWKTSREEIISCVNSLVHSLLTSDSSLENMDGSISDGALWDRFCDNIPTQHRHFTRSKGDNATPYVIVIDDNMYYRSMRYKYCQLSRKYGQGFCQVHLSCTQEVARQRNRARKHGRVLDDVITAMATKMEIPDPSNYPWEKYSITVESSDLESVIPDVNKLVRCAMLDPPQTVPEDEEAKQMSRHICSMNQIHQADQILRKLISTQVQAATGMSQHQRSQFAKSCGVIKSEILKDLRAADLLVPSNIPALDAAKMEEGSFYKFVKDIFISRTPNN